MPRIQAQSSRTIPAPASTVYSILADYRNGHSRILPQRYFREFVVERGGVGAGTIIRFRMRSFGTLRTFRVEITEPEPGRTLVETDLETRITTRFAVHSTAERQAHVIVATEWTSPGMRGWFERLLAPGFLRRVYAETLDNLARLATSSEKPTPHW